MAKKFVLRDVARELVDGVVDFGVSGVEVEVVRVDGGVWRVRVDKDEFKSGLNVRRGLVARAVGR